MRQHGGRTVERPGALRPTVAAAMVRLAGRPRSHLLDPCCGSGTILAEATAAGWACRGFDLDPEAVQAARRNAPGAEIEVGDARRLELSSGSIAACVSNLPFGRRYAPQGRSDRWLGEVLAELRRVTQPDGRLVLLAPRLDRRQVPTGLRQTERLPIRLLGLATTIWAFDRR
ncbi:MAG: methyltransferase domain-containing protein, partial [Candidatus Dormibacteraeota bacterium]|nr:methyltransferase domain-containing protein [Candidatus Dormibacteraeota bacterium]